jgi:hypothetical protein
VSLCAFCVSQSIYYNCGHLILLFLSTYMHIYYTNERTSSDLNGVDYARHLKITKTKSFFFFKGALTHVLLTFKPCRLLAKVKLMPLAKVFCLNKGNMTFNGI